MKTDTLFHELFQLAPYTLFELLQIEPACTYHFESPTVKASERRLDGLLEPEDPSQPRFFVEIQGYWDKTIYWRALHEVSLYHEHAPELNGTDTFVVVLFIDNSFDPSPDTLGNMRHGHEHWLRRGCIPDMVKQVKNHSPALNVLKPLTAETQTELEQEGATWTREIRESADLDTATQHRLVRLLTQFVIQKFSRLDHTEIEDMLQLTPIEETVAGKQYIQKGIEQGIEQGIELGKELGIEQGKEHILATQISELFDVSYEDVEALIEPLESKQLDKLGLFIIRANTYEQVEAWVDEHVEKEE